jgi:hypothetical protein
MSSQPKTTARTSRSWVYRWGWFVVPTAVTFALLLFTRKDYFTGRVVIDCYLWKYYSLEAYFGFPSMVGGLIGGLQNSVPTTFAIHVALSMLAGGLVKGIAVVTSHFQRSAIGTSSSRDTDPRA